MVGSNYSEDSSSKENDNSDDKYDITGESEYSRESTIPYDEDEVLSERHYNFSPDILGRERIRRRQAEGPDYRGLGPRGYRKSDEAIKEDVSEALFRSRRVDASSIEVFVHEGDVTLRGMIADRKQKKLAESTIENIAGVSDVFNELRIVTRKSGPKGGLIQNRTGMI